MYKRITLKKCHFGEGVEFGRSCIFEGRNYLSRDTYLNNVRMGFGSYTGKKCFLEGTEVGRYTCIGPNVTVAIGRHPTSTFVSQHPAFFSTESPIGFSYVKKNKFEEIRFAKKYEQTKEYSVVIGSDVWIGANVIILDGVTIGDGAIIAAGSIVTKDVAPYTIVGGIPAKEIKRRFNQDVADKLTRIKWWEKSEEYIASHAESFENVDLFISSLD